MTNCFTNKVHMYVPLLNHEFNHDFYVYVACLDHPECTACNNKKCFIVKKTKNKTIFLKISIGLLYYFAKKAAVQTGPL